MSTPSFPNHTNFYYHYYYLHCQFIKTATCWVHLEVHIYKYEYNNNKSSAVWWNLIRNLWELEKEITIAALNRDGWVPWERRLAPVIIRIGLLQKIQLDPNMHFLHFPSGSELRTSVSAYLNRNGILEYDEKALSPRMCSMYNSRCRFSCSPFVCTSYLVTWWAALAPY